MSLPRTCLEYELDLTYFYHPLPALERWSIKASPRSSLLYLPNDFYCHNSNHITQLSGNLQSQVLRSVDFFPSNNRNIEAESSQQSKRRETPENASRHEKVSSSAPPCHPLDTPILIESTAVQLFGPGIPRLHLDGSGRGQVIERRRLPYRVAPRRALLHPTRPPPRPRIPRSGPGPVQPAAAATAVAVLLFQQPQQVVHYDGLGRYE